MGVIDELRQEREDTKFNSLTNREQFELAELRPIKEKVRLVEKEMAEKDRVIRELETDLHNALVGVYDRDIYIEQLEKLVAAKAESDKAHIAKLKTKLILFMRCSQIPRIKAVEAFCPNDDTKVWLRFDPVKGGLISCGIFDNDK